MNDLNQVSIADVPIEKLSEKRRAFIKRSSIAIPAVLTLHSGAALAATSLSCIVKNQANPPKPTPAGVTSATDNWGRVQTKCVTLSTHVTVFEWPVNSQFWYDATENNHSTPYIQQSPNLIWKQNNGPNITATSAITPCYVLVEFDQNGNITGYGATTTFAGASTSCLTSLAITP
jgi:hypothetical protein